MPKDQLASNPFDLNTETARGEVRNLISASAAAACLALVGIATVKVVKF